MEYEFRPVLCNICEIDDADVLGVRSPRSAEIPERRKARVVRCRGCGLIYPSPMPYPDGALLQAQYEDTEGYFPQAIDAERLAGYGEMMASIEGALGGKGRILDVGSGRGELLLVAKQRGWSALGFDVSRAFARSARERAGVPVFAGEFADMPLDASSLDAVSSVSVLHNVHDPKAYLRIIHRALRPGGILFLEVTNNGGLLYRVADRFHRLRGDGLTSHLSPTFLSYQLYGFGAGSLATLLAATGFELVSMTISGGVSAMPRVTSWRARAARAALVSVMLLAKALGQGGVLTVVARRLPS